MTELFDAMIFKGFYTLIFPCVSLVLIVIFVELYLIGKAGK
jgi:hypothetical protein